LAPQGLLRLVLRRKAINVSPMTDMERPWDKIGGVEGRYLKLMILQIDDKWFWDAPPSEVKNKRLHGIPLPPMAQRILHPRQQQGKVFDGLVVNSALGASA
jgi:hypothetical protein